MDQRFDDVPCTVCGCVCDDLSVTVAGGRVTRAERACALAEPWFLAQTDGGGRFAEVGGIPATVEDAVAHAAAILDAAKAPLIYGLSRSSTAAQRAAVALADKIGATIDTTASTGHAPSIVALQQVGESTCTLGEVAARADLVIFWGSDPVVTHPRHLERYSADPVGRFVPAGRNGRHLVVVNTQDTETAKLADAVYRVDAGRQWDALWELRLLVAGKGDASSPLAPLAERMRACRFGVVFFGNGLTGEPHPHRAVAALLELVTDLNRYTRFYARRMRRYGDVAGADSVLAWQTGYPFGVNFARGYPRYTPGQFTGPELLSRGDADACLFVGGGTARDFPPAALEHLRRIPVVVLDPPNEEPVVPAAVRIATAVYGIHRPGTAYRMDEIPVPLPVLIPTQLPTDEDVLAGILSRVAARSA